MNTFQSAIGSSSVKASIESLDRHLETYAKRTIIPKGDYIFAVWLKRGFQRDYTSQRSILLYQCERKKKINPKQTSLDRSEFLFISSPNTTSKYLGPFHHLHKNKK